MKNVSAFALFVAATFITAASAPAQANLEKATVPFNFTVGTQTVPAGSYTISSPLPSRNFVAIASRDNGVGFITLGLPGQDNPKQADKLVFDKVGDKYYLREIRSSNSAMNIHFATTKAEKKAKAQIEEAGRFVDDPVLIALN